MRARDIMTRRVIVVESDATVMRAARLMLQNRISGLPVIDAAGSLVGIVTEGDFLRRAELGTQRRRSRWLGFLVGPGQLATEYVSACGRKVHEVMTAAPCTITEDTALEDIVKLMERHRIKRLPVMRDGDLVGIVSRANLLHALASLAREAQPAAGDDTTIRDRISSELSKQPWAPLGLISVVVRNGIVEIWGAITDERERQALIVAAENVPGVKGVRDHLIWIDPMSGTVVLGPEQEGAAREAS
jgi:CBS domain-containing protein